MHCLCPISLLSHFFGESPATIWGVLDGQDLCYSDTIVIELFAMRDQVSPLRTQVSAFQNSLLPPEVISYSVGMYF